MPIYIFRARFVVISLVTAISMLGGIALVFRLGTRSGLERLHTYEIVGMLALLFLPLLTLWALYADDRAARVAAARDEGVARSRQGGGEGLDPDEDGNRPVRVWATAGEVARHEPSGAADAQAGRHRHRTRGELQDRSAADA